MNERIIEIEADSLEEARRSLYTDDLIVLKESILCRGRVKTVESIACTIEEAIIKAKSRIPTGAKIEPHEVKIAPKRVVLQVEGDSEESAGKGKAEIIESVSLHKKGRRGFLGFGKTPNVYEVVVLQQAAIEVRFQQKVRLLAIVKDYKAKELLRSVEELRAREARWTETFESLNPQNDSEIRSLLVQLQDLYPSDLLSALSFIETVCHRNEKANCRTAIKEAYRQAAIARAEIEAEIKRQEEAIKEAQRQAAIARARELREREVKLRKLDVEIAEVFMFFTSIDWYEKDYARMLKEPTGLPRTGYGKEHVPSPTMRRTIPHYSTDEKAFNELKERIKGWNLSNRYLECLTEVGQDESTATFEQKCVASLKAKRSEGETC